MNRPPPSAAEVIAQECRQRGLLRLDNADYQEAVRIVAEAVLARPVSDLAVQLAELRARLREVREHLERQAAQLAAAAERPPQPPTHH